MIGLCNEPTTQRASRHKQVLLILLLVALLLRVIMFLAVTPYPKVIIHRDSRSYIQPAVNLLVGHGFSQAKEPPFTPDTRRTPIYPLFIASLYSKFGQHVLVIAMIQVVLSTMTVGLTYFLGNRMLPERAARTGAWFLIFSLGAIVYAVYVMTETLFTILVLGAIYAIVAYHETQRWWWAIVGGVFVGTATLCRPVLLLYVPIFAIFIAWGEKKRKWRTLTGLLLFLLIVVLVIAPWILRNYHLLGIATLSTITDYNLLFYNAVSLEADLRGAGQATVRTEMVERTEDILGQMEGGTTEVKRTQLYRRLGRRIILAHPWRYTIIHLKNDLNNLLPNVTELLELLRVTKGNKGTLSVLNQHGLWPAIDHYFGGRIWLIGVVSPLIALLGLTYLSALIGVVTLIKQHQWFMLALLLMTAAYFLLVPGAPSNPRFRVPAMPYLCLLAGLGWDVILYHIDRYRTGNEPTRCSA